jgi:transcription termination/antitermination protein NusG
MATKLQHLWYVLHTKSRFENVVNDGLINKSVEAFLPKVQVRSKRRDRKAMITVPLFPGYMFVKTDLSAHNHLEIVKTTGVVRLIGTQDGPVPVSHTAIESLKIMVEGNNQISTGYRLKKGDPVIVIAGPLTGVTGIFVRYRGQERVVVNIEALGQYASVEVHKEDVEILSEIFS